MLASEPVGGRSRAPELPCLTWRRILQKMILIWLFKAAQGPPKCQIMYNFSHFGLFMKNHCEYFCAFVLYNNFMNCKPSILRHLLVWWLNIQPVPWLARGWLSLHVWSLSWHHSVILWTIKQLTHTGLCCLCSAVYS